MFSTEHETASALPSWKQQFLKLSNLGYMISTWTCNNHSRVERGCCYIAVPSNTVKSEIPGVEQRGLLEYASLGFLYKTNQAKTTKTGY